MAKKTLYRLIWEHDFNTQICTPTIPLGAIGEDEDTPRICVADSISGCLISLGGGYIGELGMTRIVSRFRQLNPDARLNMEQIWRSVTFPFTILEFDVELDDPSVLTPEQIKDKVQDAVITGEHWILTERQPDRISKRWLYRAKVEDTEFVLSNGHKVRGFIFSDDRWAKEERKPDLTLLKEINRAFVKTLEQYSKQGHYF